MQIQKLASGIWHQVLSSNKNYLVNQSNPELFEEILYRMSPSNPEDDTNNLFLYKQPTGDFIYIFQNNVFKISDTQDIVIFDFSRYEKEVFHVLVTSDSEKLSLFSITSKQYDPASDSLPELIGSFPWKKLPLDSRFWRTSLRFDYHNGYYYFNVSKLLAYTRIVGLKKRLTYFRFNKYKLETWTVSTKSHFNFQNNTLLESIITPKGIFDASSFKFFNLRDLYASLRYTFDAYSYKIFNLNPKKRILFISKNEIYYPYLGKGSIDSKEEKGFLYDFKNKKFVYPNHTEPDFWHNFILYDSELPNIFKTENDGKFTYHVIYWDNHTKSFSCIDSTEEPMIISLYDDSEERKNVLLFIKSIENPELGTLIVLNHFLQLELMEEDVCFEAIVSLKKDSCFSTPKHSLVNIDVLHEHIHSSINSSLVLGFIVSSNKGTAGEFVYIPYRDKIQIDYSKSFFSYEFFTCTNATYFDSSKTSCVTPYLKAYCRRNDFENQTFIIQLKKSDYDQYEPRVFPLIKDF